MPLLLAAAVVCPWRPRLQRTRSGARTGAAARVRRPTQRGPPRRSSWTTRRCFRAATALLLLPAAVGDSAEDAEWGPAARGGLCSEVDEAWLAEAELVDPAALPPGSEVFSCGGKVVLVEGFLSAAEAEELRGLAESQAALDPRKGAWRYAAAIAGQYAGAFDLAEVRQQHAAFDAARHAAVNALERRLAAFLKIPATPFENYLQLSAERPGGEPLFHHDKNQALARLATGLVYLSGGLDGGETIFPALRAGPAGPDQRRRLEQLAEVMRGGLREPTAWPHLAAEGPLAAELAALCAGADAGETLAITPVAGRAVFYWHETGDGEILPETWHAGCPVKRGVKVAAQKFKSFAPGTAECEARPYCRHGWRLIAESQEL